MKFALIVLGLITLSALPAHAQNDDAAYEQTQEDEDLSAWERNRREHLDKREAYLEKRTEFRQKYKKRIGSNKYRQKAREFYGRQPNIYDNEK